SRRPRTEPLYATTSDRGSCLVAEPDVLLGSRGLARDGFSANSVRTAPAFTECNCQLRRDTDCLSGTDQATVTPGRPAYLRASSAPPKSRRPSARASPGRTWQPGLALLVSGSRRSGPSSRSRGC